MDSLAASKHSSALMRLVSVLAALNTGKVKPDDMFDSGVGIFVYDNDIIYDHNWRKRDYGELTLRQALAYSSDVAITGAVDEAFPDKKDFLASVRKLSFGHSLKVEGLKVDFCLQNSEMPWCYYAMEFRHAFVLISIVAAVITPPDLFTCIMVLLPRYGLYEVSIFVVGKVSQG